MIVVYTAITGLRDTLRTDQFWALGGDVRFIAFLDKQTSATVKDPGKWEIVEAPDLYPDPRMNAKMPKLVPHLFFDAEYSIWMDGCFALRKNARDVVFEALAGGADIAAFPDKRGRSISDQMDIFSKRHPEQAPAIEKQRETYTLFGENLKRRASECGVLVRRHSKRVEDFGHFWWSEVFLHSIRDQLSFLRCVERQGIRLADIVGTVSKSQYFTKNSHCQGAL